MRGFLLDTNAVSEASKPNPHGAVMDLLNSGEQIWMSAIAVHELRYGVTILRQGRRRDALEAWLSQADFEDRIIIVDLPIAELAADLRAQVYLSGRELRLPDALIAATAIANDLALVTRNVKDFEGLAVEVVNPWG